MTEADIPSQLAGAFSELSHLLLSRETPESTLRLIAVLTTRVIPACDGAGVTLISGRRILTVAQTNHTVELVDEIQRETGQGPCVAAIADHAPLSIVVDDMQAESRWPQYAARVAELGVGSMIAFTLHADDLLGSLNLYADQPHAFSPDDGAVGAVFAAHAAVALANAQTHDANTQQIENLQTALDTRSVISQAVGILMERDRISSDEAFQRLRGVSQRLNRRVRDVAQDVLQITEHRHRDPR